MIDQDDFEQWSDNPVTQVMFNYCKHLEEALREEWLSCSWYRGEVDERLLADIRARAQALEDVRTWKFEDLEEWLSEEHRNQQD